MKHNLNYILEESDLFSVGYSPTVKFVKRSSDNIILKNNLNNKVFLIEKTSEKLYNLLSDLRLEQINKKILIEYYQNLSQDEKLDLRALIENDIIRVNYYFVNEFLKKDYFTLSKNDNYKLLILNGFSLIIANEILEKLESNSIFYIPRKEFIFDFKIPEGYPKDTLSLIEIEMTNLCNLKCKYCYVDKEHPRTISKEILNNILDFLEKKNIKHKNLTIQFFGGEPLLEIDKIKYFVKEAKNRKLKFNYVIQTNGTNVTDEICQYCIEENIGLGFSSDGDIEVNNEIRPFKKNVKNSGVFIERGMLKADSYNLFGGIMTVLTKYNSHNIGKNIKRWSSIFSDVSLKISPLLHNPHIKKESSDISITPYELHNCLKKLSKLHSSNLNFQWKDLNSIKDQILYLELNDLCSSRGCRFGNNLVTINQDGDIFPCTHFSNQDSFKISNINDLNDNSEIIEFTDNLKNNRFSANCDSCFLWAFCRGGCISQNLNKKYNTQKGSYTDCDYKKNLFEIVGNYILDEIC